MAELPPPGWYPNPENDAEQRYWDGQQWTDHTAPLAGSGPASPPPESSAPPGPGEPPGWSQPGQQAPGGPAWGPGPSPQTWGPGPGPGGAGWYPQQGGAWGNPPGSPAWQQAQSIDPWLWQSIVATILGLCCYFLPGLVGIPAIVFASQANGARSRGMVEETREKARLARIFTLVSAGLTLLAIVGLTILIVVGAVSDPTFR